MTLVSWAKKELARLGIHKPKRLPLPATSLAPVKCPTMSPIQEVVLAADLHCAKCQNKVADVISRIDDIEFMVVHVLEKKVTLAGKSE
ncbi:unnamed protein product [Ilex paraguariensis]|uniref:HMA domain-containing protein n=1 Tax=Ilex paraguariensis TaxID=185542 RepID=A0ABC8RRV2_9AQUA